MKNPVILFLSFLGILSCLLLTSCGQKKRTDKPVVFVTIEPLRYFAEQIAGDHYQICSMVTDGNSPELYDPTPRQLLDFTSSKAYIYVGKLGFEQQWLQKLKENAPEVRFCDSSEGITYLNEDPHTWTTPSNAILISRNMCELFCELDTLHREEYIKNQAELVTKIQQADASIRKTATEGMQPAFGIYHPSLTYFANDYGLTQYCIEKEGKEPSPAQLEQLIRQCRKAGVKTIFVQKEFNTHNAEIIAKACGADLVAIDPLNYNWPEEMIHIANSLKK